MIFAGLGGSAEAEGGKTSARIFIWANRQIFMAKHFLFFPFFFSCMLMNDYTFDDGCSMCPLD